MIFILLQWPDFCQRHLADRSTAPNGAARDLIFIRDGRIYTSGGVTAGIDLAMAMVEEGHGRDIALLVARRMLMFLRRHGKVELNSVSKEELMRILLVASAYNGLCQRAHIELTLRGHEVSVELFIDEEAVREGIALFKPDLVICPFLKQHIPDDITTFSLKTGKGWRKLGACVRL